MSVPVLRSACLALLLTAAGCSFGDESSSKTTARAVATGDSASALGAFDPADVTPGAIVVDFKDGTSKADIDAWEKEWGVDLEFNSIEGTESGVTIAVGVGDVAQALARIRQNPEVEAAEPMARFSVPTPAETSELAAPPTSPSADFPNDPLYSKQWNLTLIDAPSAWKRTTGKGVTVAVIDTGIAYENKGDFILVPDLNGAKFSKGYDFVNDDDGAHDDHGHGTHVAGTIAQVTNNKEGVAGVAFDATLMPVKVLDSFGYGNAADIADAIRWAADNGANVINMSLGGGMRSAVMENAVKYAREKGVTVVCAAGNGGRGTVEFPAAYEGCVAVSALGPDKKLAPYSSWGKELDLSAPGGNKAMGDESGILQNTLARSDYTRAVYEFYQGTSMATPHVAGVAALLYSAGAKTPEQVEQALYQGAKKADGQDGWSDKFGHGVLNANGALDALGKGRGPLGIDWKPLLVALGMLVVVLLTMRRKERPGYLNILFTPTFLVPLVLATVGFFVLRFFSGSFGGNELATLFELPIPDWERIIFGRGKLANPLFYSALIPILLSILAVPMKGLRPLVSGLALGFAAFLAYAAWANAPGLSWMPFKFLAVPWLVVNTIICLFITRAMLKKDVAA